MKNYLTTSLLFVSFLFLMNSYGQQFGSEISESIIGIMYGDIKSADLDGDGDEDMIVSGRPGINGGGTTRIYENLGGGSFSNTQNYLPGLLFSSIATGDIDNDGDIDLFLSGSSNNGYYSGIFKNDGNGIFTEMTPNVFTNVCIGSSIFFDANGDGYKDLFYFGRSGTFSGITKFYLNNGNGQFTDSPISIEAFQTGSVAAADYDKDGDLDLLISGETNINPAGDRTKLFNNDGNAFFTEIQYPFPGLFQGCAVFSDIDKDNDLDIIINGRTNGVNTHYSQFHINDGMGNYTHVGNRGLDSLGSCSLALADVDMDNDDDIFLMGKTKGGVDTSALYYNEDGFFTKDLTHYSQGLTQGGARFMRLDYNCSPDLVYFGFGDSCLTQTYCFLNTNQTLCPKEEEPSSSPGTNSMNDMSYRVLSNPFNQYVRVEVSEKVDFASIYDLNGRLIYKYSPDSQTIDIQMMHVANGLYNLVFTTENTLLPTVVRLSKTD